jgi:hypothetical protein
MSDNNNNENSNENKTENMPDFSNIILNLFDQVRSQANRTREAMGNHGREWPCAGPAEPCRHPIRRVRIQEEKNESNENDENDSDSDSDEESNVNHKLEIMVDLADSHRILCRAFAQLLANDELNENI